MKDENARIGPDSCCRTCAFLMSDGQCLCNSDNFGTEDGCKHTIRRVPPEE